MKAATWLIFFGLGHLASAQYCTQKVPITVIDERSGQAVSGLSIHDFKASYKNSGLQISGLKQIHTRRLLILADRSGSIAGAEDDVSSHTKKATQTALHVIDDMLQQLPAGMSVEYAAFSDVTVFGGNFTSDTTALRKSLQFVNTQLPKRGHKSTAIYDAIDQALVRFDNPQPEDAILLLTDGEETSSKESVQAVEKKLRVSGVRLFVMLLASHTFIWIQQSRREELIALSRRSGGTVHVLDVTNQGWGFEKPVRAASEELRRFWNEEVLNGYVLTLEVPTSFNREKKWSLSLTDSRVPKAVLSYPDRLSPCSVESALGH